MKVKIVINSSDGYTFISLFFSFSPSESMCETIAQRSKRLHVAWHTSIVHYHVVTVIHAKNFMNYKFDDFVPSFLYIFFGFFYCEIACLTVIKFVQCQADERHVEYFTKNARQWKFFENGARLVVMMTSMCVRYAKVQ